MIKNHVYVLWDKFYKQSKTGLFYKSFFPSVFSTSTSSSPTLFRLRMGHCKLNSHLHKIGLYSLGLCSSCFVPEDVEHVHLYCPRYSIPRNLFRYHLQTIKVDFTFYSIGYFGVSSFIVYCFCTIIYLMLLVFVQCVLLLNR